MGLEEERRKEEERINLIHFSKALYVTFTYPFFFELNSLTFTFLAWNSRPREDGEQERAKEEEDIHHTQINANECLIHFWPATHGMPRVFGSWHSMPLALP